MFTRSAADDGTYYEDLCWECGREIAECACGTTIPDDFDPLDESGPDLDWDAYENDLTKETDDEE